MALPLEGYRILDYTEVWAGPMGMSLLGDLGAEIIKVESFPRSSITRPPIATPLAQPAYAGDVALPRSWERYSIHNMANRNKLGMTVNINHPRGMELFRKLIPVSDVLVDGYSAGTVDRLGLGYDKVKALNPSIVMLSMPGWGVQGPYKGYVTLGSGIDAYVGHHALRAYPDLDVGSANG
ncbi:MAG: CoA transferase, partial [Chloroflexi bacterium]|nr:CoA transferase [Chloroflexota bacterium]